MNSCVTPFLKISYVWLECDESVMVQLRNKEGFNDLRFRPAGDHDYLCRHVRENTFIGINFSEYLFIKEYKKSLAEVLRIYSF